jgi:hypothetical protein
MCSQQAVDVVKSVRLHGVEDVLVWAYDDHALLLRERESPLDVPTC